VVKYTFLVRTPLPTLKLYQDIMITHWSIFISLMLFI